MKNKFPLLMVLTAMFLTIFLIATPVSAKIADGTYKVNYEMKEAGNGNTSIADGYFSKPATLIVENGVQYIQLTLTSADMIKSLGTPAGTASIISENKANKTRTVKFKVNGDLSQPLNMDMHIVVPDLYDMKHTARAVFDVSGLKQAAAPVKQKSADSGSEKNSNAKESVESGTENDADAKEVVENPKTGDDSPIALYALLLIGSAIALFAIRKLKPARN
ncbi:NEAT domain-containing protein [Sporosarcina sp. G11-34]|uniref:NEAT domain-containing protein n=1 Tax=Sporosarcina sp. G11-34 TaxID=2849605 RepID=UPI0022A97083|nr:NEAT domain-containing protein [Sporosarcina sp. G11-34]MCZ2258575.1 NEAT domain-containing protein [Sporosarcina sp. G11-34]